jgi:DNA-binding NarL/FixJ family response regulator
LVKLRAVVVSHHKSFRHDLAQLVELIDSCVEVVGDCASAREAMSQIGALKPDVVLVDLALRTVTGLELTERIHLRWPMLAVLVIGNEPDNDYHRLALEAGAVDYVDVLQISSQLHTALMRIDRDGVCVDERVLSEVPIAPPQARRAVSADLHCRLCTSPTGPKHGPLTAWQYVHVSLAITFGLIILNALRGVEPSLSGQVVLASALVAVTILEARQFVRAHHQAISSWPEHRRGGAVAIE